MPRLEFVEDLDLMVVCNDTKLTTLLNVARKLAASKHATCRAPGSSESGTPMFFASELSWFGAPGSGALLVQRKDGSIA